ncbi:MULTISPECIES: hypothetical protein [unclassified Halorubrum]|uniref:hypothetical protein n=1 Tax=unclassified Halorubrum TaxID=2642239 RepID=UPI0011C35AFD|nr:MULTISPECIES: hypothetical protein [unclassified Halorubrum]
MYTLDRDLEEHITELSDGFLRLGDRDTPFTLQGGGDKRIEAAQFHQTRDADIQERDELRNEPVTRNLDKWKDNPRKYDFPHVDTIRHEKLKQRATEAEELVKTVDLISKVRTGVKFNTDGLYGQYLPGPEVIEIGQDTFDFLGYRTGPVLAHEVGHVLYDAVTPDAGHEENPPIFETDQQQAEARRISERLHGPIPESDIDGISSSRMSESELFAEVFTSLVIEGEAAGRVAPNASKRVRDTLVDHFELRIRLLFDG